MFSQNLNKNFYYCIDLNEFERVFIDADNYIAFDLSKVVFYININISSIKLANALQSCIKYASNRFNVFKISFFRPFINFLFNKYLDLSFGPDSVKILLLIIE